MEQKLFLTSYTIASRFYITRLRRSKKGNSYTIKFDGLVKSLKTVMPDLIRHPEVIEFTGFRLSPE